MTGPVEGAAAESGEPLLFGVRDLHVVRALVRRRALAAGLSDESADDLVLGVHEIAVCAFAADEGPALLDVRELAHWVVCEIREPGSRPGPARGPGRARLSSRLTDPAVGPGRGWRIARSLCHDVRGTGDGTAVRIAMVRAPVAEPSPGGLPRPPDESSE